MAFKISSATEGTYTWPVPVWIPVDGGKRRKEEFQATFKRFKQGEEPLAPESVTEEDGVEVFKRFLAGWSGIKDDEGNELPFTDENLREFLTVPVFVTAITDAFRNSIGQAKEKN